MADGPPVDTSTLWEIKARVEQEFPDFPHIDVSAPDFSREAYLEKVMDLYRAMGIPRDDITISFHNLTSTVPVEAPDDAIKTFVSAFDGIVHLIKNGTRKARRLGHHSTAASTLPDEEKVPEYADVLSNISGVIEPGTMTLVLGPSGSGSSLLLSRIAGRQIGSQVVNQGKILYNGEDMLHGFIRPSHFVQHVGQYDDHIPQVTVRHTLDFAARCKWPEWIPHVEAIRRNDVILTARMLRIERVLDTIVGNEILRGVSGGERKRTTIAEMLIGLSSGAVVMDNWSKGLDASTTLSITRSMREFANQTRCGVVTSMQAPGVQTFEEFDTVMVLEQGHVIYYGPREEAEKWFLSLGFRRPAQRSVPDFIATVANPEMRREYLPHNVDMSGLIQAPPQTAEEFAARFAESRIAANMDEKVEAAAKFEPVTGPIVPECISKAASKPNLQEPRHQIRALGRRQVWFYGATRNAVIADFVQNLILGTILGSIFWQLPDNAGGAASRVGIVFLALIFMGLSALSKLRDKHEEKIVFAKQKGSSFYNAWPYILTMELFDVVLEFTRSICFVVPLYLMSGLNLGSSGQRLLYDILIITMLSLVMVSFTRLLTAVFEDPDAAQGVGGVLTIVMILFAGYIKPPDKIQDWLKWIYWVNPIHYVFEALTLNEYEGLTFACEQDERLPFNNAIPMNVRVCPVSTGREYLENNLGITIGNIFRLYYFLVLIAYLVVLTLLSATATALVKPKGHAMKWRSINGSVRFDGDPDLDSTTITLSRRRPFAKPSARFTFSDLKYSVQNGSRLLLDRISGYAVGGKVVLLMGESGAGKSTLLDVCALRKTMKKGTSMEGNIHVNGHPVTKDLVSRRTGYCEQNDIHIGEATVKEAVIFSAKLRLPATISEEEKRSRAMDTLELLDLTSYSDILVKALGAGELKLLTMALEVVADPVVLFLDEPTSGISASSALVVANALRNIANTGTSVICTVHQPSSEVFGMFDQLLLLKRGGKQVYFGDIGENGKAICSYFEARGAPPKAQAANTADWMLDVIADESIDYPAEWQNSTEKSEMDKEIEDYEHADSDGIDIVKEPFQRVTRPKQISEVIRRLFKRYWRLPEYNFTRVAMMFIIAVFIGLLFLRDIDNSQTGAALAFGALFLTVIPSSLQSQNVIPPTADGRAVFYREVASGTYTPFAFHIALGLVEIPFTFVATTAFTTVFYFMVGLDPSRFFYFFLAAQLLYFFSVMFGVLLASITPNRALALTIVSSVTSVFNVLSGFFITKDEMPDWWRWSTWVNPFAYYLSGILQNQMEDRELICRPDELGVFQKPETFESCSNIPGGDYSDVVVNGANYCTFCPLPSGDVIIDRFGADAVNKWVSLLALVVAILICRFFAGIGFAKLRFISR